MAVTITDAVCVGCHGMYQDAFVGSAMENGTTIIRFDLRQHDFHQEWGRAHRICWRKEPYHVDVHELSTFHNPIAYRFIVAQGAYHERPESTGVLHPEIKGVSTSQHMSHSVIRLACYSRGGLRGQPPADCAPLSRAVPDSDYQSVDQALDDAIGAHCPTPEEMLQQLLALAPATECHLDGYYPLGTDNL